ncbi:hypothetical protein V6246_02850 [Algibacter sp. TI.3.09]|uniref:hypothetical protein n=1 Tax=Algibacter sp. TI.3.09 TaxID=3121298 RepID=UPI00311D5B0D
MKKFLIKSILFFLVVITIISTILITSGGYVDYFYEKFTTPKSSSFILGDSRSMQGIQPSVIDSYFNNKDHEYQLPIMNYSFTIAQIAYGPLYTESIKRKLSPDTKNGLFIITVNPWILSEREEDDVKNSVFFEEGMPPHNMEQVSISPNFEYFIKNFDYFHFKSIVRRTSKMHKDGWLEESNLPKDSLMLKSWKKNQVIMYEGFSEKWNKSAFRLKSLESLITYLATFGDIFLLRMPIDKDIMQVETNFWPNFDADIQEIAVKKKINYLNLSHDNNYKTYDGNHLDKYGGVDFTKNLCDSIYKLTKHSSK